LTSPEKKYPYSKNKFRQNEFIGEHQYSKIYQHNKNGSSKTYQYIKNEPSQKYQCSKNESSKK
jgi:hypothetical protein